MSIYLSKMEKRIISLKFVEINGWAQQPSNSHGSTSLAEVYLTKGKLAQCHEGDLRWELVLTEIEIIIASTQI